MQYVKTAIRFRINLEYCNRRKAIVYTTAEADELFDWLADFVGEAKHFSSDEIAGEDWVIRVGARDAPHIDFFDEDYGEQGIYICFRHEYDAVKFKMSDLAVLQPGDYGWHYGTNEEPADIGYDPDPYDFHPDDVMIDEECDDDGVYDAESKDKYWRNYE